jgi:hypothetical protein
VKAHISTVINFGFHKRRGKIGLSVHDLPIKKWSVHESLHEMIHYRKQLILITDAVGVSVKTIKRNNIEGKFILKELSPPQTRDDRTEIISLVDSMRMA